MPRFYKSFIYFNKERHLLTCIAFEIYTFSTIAVHVHYRIMSIYYDADYM